jgi:hypothetical protein
VVDLRVPVPGVNSMFSLDVDVFSTCPVSVARITIWSGFGRSRLNPRRLIVIPGRNE